MNTEKPIKKGFIAMLRESFQKSGGCCGAGETCGAPSKEDDKAQSKRALETSKPAQREDVKHE